MSYIKIMGMISRTENKENAAEGKIEITKEAVAYQNEFQYDKKWRSKKAPMPLA
jgi:hypothetical protein